MVRAGSSRSRRRRPFAPIALGGPRRGSGRRPASVSNRSNDVFPQPTVSVFGVREEPRRYGRTSHAEIDVAHHPAKRSCVDEKPERGESIDEHLARVIVTYLRIERLAAADVDEKRPSLSVAR